MDGGPNGTIDICKKKMHNAGNKIFAYASLYALTKSFK